MEAKLLLLLIVVIQKARAHRNFSKIHGFIGAPIEYLRLMESPSKPEKPNRLLPDSTNVPLPDTHRTTTALTSSAVSPVTQRTSATKNPTPTRESFTKFVGFPIYVNDPSTTIPTTNSNIQPDGNRRAYPYYVRPIVPGVKTEEFITKGPKGGILTSRNATANRPKAINTSELITGLCGYPPYNNRDTCRNLNFLSEPLSECENQPGKFMFGILIGCSAVAIVLVNCLIPAVVLTNSDMRTHYDLIKVSLAVADVIIGVLMFTTVIPNMVWISNLSEEEVVKFSRTDTNSPTAIIVGSFLTVTMQASLLHLCFMTIERFFVIKWPFWRMRRKTRSVVITLIAIWMTSIVSGFIPAVFPQNFEYKFQPALLIHMLTMKPTAGISEAGYEGMIYITFTLILPYVLMVAVCVLTGVVSYRKLRSTARLFGKERIKISVLPVQSTNVKLKTNDRCSLAAGRNNAKSLQPEIAVFITIIIMICAFTLTLMPFFVVVSLFVAGVINCGNYTMPYVTAFYFGLLNSLANGIIYSVRDPRFRKAVKNLFCKDAPKYGK